MALNNEHLRKIQGCMKCAFHLGIAKDHGKEAEFLEIVGGMITQISQGLKCDEKTFEELTQLLLQMGETEITAYTEACVIVKDLNRLFSANIRIGFEQPAPV